jgi:GNAT superfamily N-acetyltransferase
MIIRKAIQSDIEEIAENDVLLAKETEKRIISKSVVRNGIHAVFSDGRKGFYIVAEEQHSIVGQIFVTIEWSEWRNQSIWWLHRIYVKRQWRKKGIFTTLLQKLKQMARNEEVYTLRLYMMNENVLALNTYKKIGFVKSNFIILENKNLNSS